MVAGLPLPLIVTGTSLGGGGQQPHVGAQVRPIYPQTQTGTRPASLQGKPVALAKQQQRSHPLQQYCGLLRPNEQQTRPSLQISSCLVMQPGPSMASSPAQQCSPVRQRHSPSPLQRRTQFSKSIPSQQQQHAAHIMEGILTDIAWFTYQFKSLG